MKAIVLYGSRQTGKTTTLNRLAELLDQSPDFIERPCNCPSVHVFEGAPGEYICITPEGFGPEKTNSDFNDLKYAFRQLNYAARTEPLNMKLGGTAEFVWDYAKSGITWITAAEDQPYLDHIKKVVEDVNIKNPLWQAVDIVQKSIGDLLSVNGFETANERDAQTIFGMVSSTK